MNNHLPHMKEPLRRGDQPPETRAERKRRMARERQRRHRKRVKEHQQAAALAVAGSAAADAARRYPDPLADLNPTATTTTPQPPPQPPQPPKRTSRRRAYSETFRNDTTDGILSLDKMPNTSAVLPFPQQALNHTAMLPQPPPTANHHQQHHQHRRAKRARENTPTTSANNRQVVDPLSLSQQAQVHQQQSHQQLVHHAHPHAALAQAQAQQHSQVALAQQHHSHAAALTQQQQQTHAAAMSQQHPSHAAAMTQQHQTHAVLQQQQHTHAALTQRSLIDNAHMAAAAAAHTHPQPELLTRRNPVQSHYDAQHYPRNSRQRQTPPLAVDNRRQLSHRTQSAVGALGFASQQTSQPQRAPPPPPPPMQPNRTLEGHTSFYGRADPADHLEFHRSPPAPVVNQLHHMNTAVVRHPNPVRNNTPRKEDYRYGQQRYQANSIDIGRNQANALDMGRNQAGALDMSRNQANALDMGRTQANTLDMSRNQAGALDMGRTQANALDMSRNQAGALEMSRNQANALDMSRNQAGALDMSRNQANALDMGRTQVDMGRTPANALDMSRNQANALDMGRGPGNALDMGRNQANALGIGRSQQNSLGFAQQQQQQIEKRSNDLYVQRASDQLLGAQIHQRPRNAAVAVQQQHANAFTSQTQALLGKQLARNDTATAHLDNYSFNLTSQEPGNNVGAAYINNERPVQIAQVPANNVVQQQQQHPQAMYAAAAASAQLSSPARQESSQQRVPTNGLVAAAAAAASSGVEDRAAYAFPGVFPAEGNTAKPVDGVSPDVVPDDRSRTASLSGVVGVKPQETAAERKRRLARERQRKRRRRLKEKKDGKNDEEEEDIVPAEPQQEKSQTDLQQQQQQQAVQQQQVVAAAAVAARNNVPGQMSRPQSNGAGPSTASASVAGTAGAGAVTRFPDASSTGKVVDVKDHEAQQQHRHQALGEEPPPPNETPEERKRRLARNRQRRRRVKLRLSARGESPAGWPGEATTTSTQQVAAPSQEQAQPTELPSWENVFPSQYAAKCAVDESVTAFRKPLEAATPQERVFVLVHGITQLVKSEELSRERLQEILMASFGN